MKRGSAVGFQSLSQYTIQDPRSLPPISASLGRTYDQRSDSLQEFKVAIMHHFGSMSSLNDLFQTCSTDARYLEIILMVGLCGEGCALSINPPLAAVYLFSATLGHPALDVLCKRVPTQSLRLQYRSLFSSLIAPSYCRISL